MVRLLLLDSGVGSQNSVGGAVAGWNVRGETRHALLNPEEFFAHAEVSAGKPLIPLICSTSYLPLAVYRLSLQTSQAEMHMPQTSPACLGLLCLPGAACTETSTCHMALENFTEAWACRSIWGERQGDKVWFVEATHTHPAPQQTPWRRSWCMLCL